MDKSKTLWLVVIAGLIAAGAYLLTTRQPAPVPAPVAETAAPAEATPAAPAATPAPAATEAPACLQYNWNGAAWVCTSGPAAN